ncbi:hypothetical protein BKA56DRAFT_574773 [Ilyonectria sp. MPI-CAGE-AT-0026]|nr:hypothetical protein BKA56DRAFT_574773 [Ilyonectria sp. MPI-CAGE-AT-0026]
MDYILSFGTVEHAHANGILASTSSKIFRQRSNDVKSISCRVRLLPQDITDSYDILICRNFVSMLAARDL